MRIIRQFKNRIVYLLSIIIIPIIFYRVNPFKDNIVKQDKIKYFCRRMTEDILIIKFYEKGLLFSLLSLKNYNSKGIFIDVGAHIGKYSMLMAKNGWKVVAIEPEPDNFRILKKNMSLNDLKNITCHLLACYSKNTRLRLNRLEYGTAGSTLLDKVFRGYPIKNSIMVNAEKLDNLVEKSIIPEIRLIKIDVEGAELEVLKGAKEILKIAKPSIIFEAWEHEKLPLIIKFLEKFGYNVYKEIDKDNYFMS